MNSDPLLAIDSVPAFLTEIKDGAATGAVDAVWRQFCGPLTEFAAHQLRGSRINLEDADDIASKAFFSFYVGAKLNTFRKLENRDDAWQLLRMMACKKVADLARREARQKRGGTARLSMWHAARDIAAPCGEQVEYDDELEYLLSLLPGEKLKQIAVLRIGGSTVEQIAAALGTLPRTIWRKLEVIREKWRPELGQ